MDDKEKLSVGTDIVDIQRIKDAIIKFGEKFLKKIFTEHEIEYCSKTSHNFQSLAARFAAKEAFSKALGIGIGSLLNWKDIFVQNSSSGQPTLILSKNAQNLMAKYGFHRAKISLSHTKTLAQAVVILIG